MTDQKVTDLAVAAPLDGTEIAYLVQGSTDVQAALSDFPIADSVQTALDLKLDKTVLPTATPSTPASGVTHFAMQKGSGRTMPAWVGPSGVDTRLQSFLGGNRVAEIRPNAGLNSVGLLGMGGTATGTATARTQAVTSLFTQTSRIGYVSAATAGSSANLRENTRNVWRGNGNYANAGGFHCIWRFGISDASIVSGARTFVGLYATAAVIGNVDPSTLLNIIGMGHDAADTNFYIMHNDASGTATKIDLGANFPNNATNTDLYHFELFCAPNGSTVYYYVERLNTGNTASGSITTDIGVPNTFYGSQVHRNNGATAAAVGIDLARIYMEVDI